MRYTTVVMVDKVVKCNMVLENAVTVNAVKEEECQEDNFVDDKVQISETVVLAEVQGNLICDGIKPYDTLTTFDNIKTELSLPEEESNMIHSNLKIEAMHVDDVKMEFNNALLYCEDCQVYCEDYCADCGMLVHILNRIAPVNPDSTFQQELPNGILEIRGHFGEYHIFALKVIPAGVKFGPFTGLNRMECPCKIKGGKFVVNEHESKYLNWMQYINSARNVSEQNLHVLQHEHNLYYQSTCRIQDGDELLVYFGEEYEDGLNRNVEMDFIPAVEHIIKDAFACTICCFGFSSRSYLAKHKAICPGIAGGRLSIEVPELVQCPCCKIHLDQKEYFTHYMACCCKINERKRIQPTPGNEAALENRLKTRSLQVHKCHQCKYRTKYKGDLKNHANQHHEVKMYRCGACHRRFKTKEALKLHMENPHICADGKDNVEHTTGVYTKAHIKAEHSCPEDEMRQCKCSLCEFRTKYEANLRTPMTRNNFKKFNFKCTTCDYKANRKSHLKMHIEARHLKVFNYKCGKCDYKSNQKSNLKRHILTKHSSVFKYKCDTCDYKTSWKSHLKIHTEARHLKAFNYYKCDACDYKSNRKSDLRRHIEAKHLKVFKYKCDRCDHRTSWKSHLKSHIEAIHVKELKYECEACDYKTSQKANLKSHIKSRHSNKFKYKCDTCDYKTNRRSDLKKHIEARHLKEFKYKCDACDYKASLKSSLERHVTGHMNEFKYKCDGCDYKSNLMANLKRHIEARHSKEFKYKCDSCDYKTHRKDNLKSHMDARHLKEFKYRCDMCDYKANRKDILKRHTETRHLKKFKYNCDTCDYKTNRMSDLKSHVESRHLKEFKYNCDSCGYRSINMRNLKKHRASKHL